jgi:hypothetical protein
MKGANTVLYLGRAIHYAIAREGALKLKESAYVQAEGYPVGELKHGPNALVGKNAPLVVLATRDENDPDSVLRYEKTLQLIRDMDAQGAEIFALISAGDSMRFPSSLRTPFASPRPASIYCRSSKWFHCNCWPTSAQSCAASTWTTRATWSKPSFRNRRNRLPARRPPAARRRRRPPSKRLFSAQFDLKVAILFAWDSCAAREDSSAIAG